MSKLTNPCLIWLMMVASFGNIQQAKGIDFFGQLVNGITGAVSSIVQTATGVVGGVLNIPVGIFAGFLGLAEPLSAPVQQILDDILNTAKNGLPLGRSQVENLLRILNISSIADLNSVSLKKVQQILNITQILEVELNVKENCTTIQKPPE